MLLSDRALAKLITGLEQKVALAKLETAKLQRDLAAEQKSNAVICSAKIGANNAKLKACNDDHARQKAIYERALNKCDRPVPWYKSPLFGYIMGNVVAGGVCGTVAVLRDR